MPTVRAKTFYISTIRRHNHIRLNCFHCLLKRSITTLIHSHIRISNMSTTTGTNHFPPFIQTAIFITIRLITSIPITSSTITPLLNTRLIIHPRITRRNTNKRSNIHIILHPTLCTNLYHSIRMPFRIRNRHLSATRITIIWINFHRHKRISLTTTYCITANHSFQTCH